MSKAREEKGIVSQGKEYEALRDKIINLLLSVKVKGKQLFNGVYKREDLYSGKYIEHAPDLVVDSPVRLLDNILDNVPLCMGTKGSTNEKRHSMFNLTGINKPAG